MMKNPKKKEVFVPFIELNEHDQIVGLHVLEGKVISEDTAQVSLLVKMPNSEMKEFAYKRENLLFDRDSADEKLFDLHKSLQLRRIKSEFPIDLLPEKIKPLTEGYFSGNPLRFGEPNIGYVAQSNTFGKFENPQKIIQAIAAIDEDIETLVAILDILYLTNNYTKKLLGKYVIIELNSMFVLFRKLAELDENYKRQYFQKLEMEILQLEKKHRFKIIRDTIAAHRDTNVDLLHSVSNWRNITRYNLHKYIDLVHAHLDDFLTVHYPNEKLQYFLVRRNSVGKQLTTPIEKDYKLFDNDVT